MCVFRDLENNCKCLYTIFKEIISDSIQGKSYKTYLPPASPILEKPTFTWLGVDSPLASMGFAPRGNLKKINTSGAATRKVLIFCLKKLKRIFFFFGGGCWGCPTPKENSLKPPKDQ